MPVPVLTVFTGQAEADACVLVATPGELKDGPYASEIAALLTLDKTATSAVSVFAAASAPGARVVLSPTGPLNRDIDDVRRIADAVTKGVKRAVSAGATAPLLCLTRGIVASPAYANALQVALLAALGALYAPLSVRELRGEAVAEPVSTVFVQWLGEGGDAAAASAATVARALELGRRVARDVGGGDPERMAPPRCAAYLADTFASLSSHVSVRIIDDVDVITKQFPLAAAVARASLHVPRHAPRMVFLDYTPKGEAVREQVILVGKGITYDTGGADVKTGGHMVGMSRDKCGAAAAAGFVRTVAELRPAGVRVVAFLGFVRNSIGSDAYVADEIITSHAGARVLVVNTDAEGRMLLSDLLSHARLEVLATPAASRPRTVVHTVATLTGHAVLAHGAGYSIAVENGPARAAGVAARLRSAGELWADPLEISTLRREDYEFVAPKTSEYDVKQVNNAPSAATPRGHQFPAAVMLIASGMDKHGVDSADPIAYCHLDMGGAAVMAPFMDGVTTGHPLPALYGAYVQ